MRIYIYIDAVRTVKFSPNSEYLATGSSDTTINLIDVNTRQLIHKFEGIHTGNNNV